MSDIESQNQGIKIAGRYEVLFSQPETDLDTPNARAFLVKDQQSSNDACYALVCGHHLHPRLHLIDQLARQEGLNCVVPIAWGHVKIPPNIGIQMQKAVVIICRKPGGYPILYDGQTQFNPWNLQQIKTQLMTPVVQTLKLLSACGVSHRNIKPSNMFFQLQDPDTDVMLGECISMPPGYAHGMAWEPLTRVAADFALRGEGGISDDLYALGVSVLVMALGQIPWAKQDPIELVRGRMNVGSYRALVPPAGLNPEFEPLLRGLLHDNPQERWNLSDLEAWLKDSPVPNRGGMSVKRGQIPFTFAGQSEIYSVERLAYEMQLSPDIMIDRGIMEQIISWLRSSIRDTSISGKMSSLLQDNFAQYEGANRRQQDLINRIVQNLNPGAPLWLGNHWTTIDGLNEYTLQVSSYGENVEEFRNMLNSSFVEGYLVEHASDSSILAKAGLSTIKKYLNNNSNGFGIERLMYELNPQLPCYSPLFLPDRVYSVFDFIVALEKLAAQPGRASQIFDRHMLAFLCARYQGLRPNDMAELAKQDLEYVVACTSILAGIQDRVCRNPLNHLCDWIYEITRPMLNSIRNQQIKQDMDHALQEASKSGRLAKILSVLQNEAFLKKDRAAYRNAKTDVMKIRSTIKVLQSKIHPGSYHFRRLAHRSTVFTAFGLGSIYMGIFLMMRYWQ